MTIEEQLKIIILERFRSVRAFTTELDMPYSTIDSILKRGISGAGIGTVIKVCNALKIDIGSIETGCLQKKKKNPAPVFGDELSDVAIEIAHAYDDAGDGIQASVRKLLDVAQPYAQPDKKGSDAV